jgi:enamine deaminase RidA (YjgF/YER057c/UK114 family)
VKDEFIPEDYPAWTVVGVTALALPELKVEIRATAVIGSA